MEIARSLGFSAATMYVFFLPGLPGSSTKNSGRNGWLRIRAQVFMNIVLDEAVEEKASGEKERLGMVVCSSPHHPSRTRAGLKYS